MSDTARMWVFMIGLVAGVIISSVTDVFGIAYGTMIGVVIGFGGYWFVGWICDKLEER